MDPIELDIDREGLRRYHRYRASIVLPACVAGVVGFFTIIAHMPNPNNDVSYESVGDFVATVGIHLAIATAIAWVIGLLIQHVCIGRFADRYAAGYRVSVEGPYLRIISDGYSYCDRKVHFRDLNEYSIMQSPGMRRAGIVSIVIGHQDPKARAPSPGTIVLEGVHDAENLRDQLSRLDGEREGHPS